MIVKPEDVEINNSRTRAQTPGSKKSIYAHIRLFRDPDDDSYGEYFRVHNVQLDDFVMGFVGAGAKRLYLTGEIIAGRYDDYNDDGGSMTWGAPGHVIYHTDPTSNAFNEVLKIGSVYDKGEYQGTTLGGLAAQSVKVLDAPNVGIESIRSEREHGVFDLAGARDALIGPISWSCENNQSDTFYGLDCFRIYVPSTAAKSLSQNVMFEAVNLSLPAGFSDDAVTIIGTTTIQIENIDMPNVLITHADGSTGFGAPISIDHADKVSINAVLDITGAGATATVVRLDECDAARIKISNIGSAKLNRINCLANVTDSQVIIDDKEIPAPYDADLLTADDTLVQTPARIFGSNGARTSSGTSHDTTLQLPQPGVYLVTAQGHVPAGSPQHCRIGSWLVTWFESAASAAQVGADTVIGSTVTALDMACSGTGLVTATWTTGSAVTIDPMMSAVPVAGLWDI